MRAAVAVITLTLATSSALIVAAPRPIATTHRAPVPSASIAVSASALTHGTAGVTALSGLVAWIAPKFNMDVYGITSNDGIGDGAYYQVRQIGAWQIVNAFVLMSGLKGSLSAASALLIASAWSTIICIPSNEYFEKPKGPAILSALAFAVLGRLTAKGRISAYVSGGVMSLLGALIVLTPKETAAMYKVTPEKATPLMLSMLAATGSTVLCTGLYVLALVAGRTQRTAFGLSILTNALFALKFTLTDAEELGAKTASQIGPLALRTAAQLILAAIALLA